MPDEVNPLETEECEDMVSESDTPCESISSISKKSFSELTPKEMLKRFRWGDLSFYEHLKHILELLVATRPRNTIDYFDQFSRSIREPKGMVRLADRLPFAQKIIRMANLLQTPDVQMEDEENLSEEEFKMKTKVVSCTDMADCFAELGLGLSMNELYQIDMALRTLAQEEGIQEVRFWGKIYGTDRPYIIAECTLTYDEIQLRQRVEGERNASEGEEEEDSFQEQLPVFGFGMPEGHLQEEEDEILYKKLYDYRMPPLPAVKKEKKPRMRPELTGEGANKKVYYVCNEPGDEWIPLPNVLPEQIVAARKMRKFFRGYLNAIVESFPHFPWRECSLLRAQIARISAGTHISPIGYFQFGSPDEMAEDYSPDDIIVNLDYDEVPFQDLLDTAFWVHHAAHILRIGRTSYPEPDSHDGEEMEEEPEHMEEDSPLDEQKKEQGPPILTPLSEDVTMEEVVPWLTKRSSFIIPAAGSVGVFSNLWPGAIAVAKGRRWANIYLGNGAKLSVAGYSPPRPPRNRPECSEYLKEAEDPSPEVEAEWRKEHRPPSPAMGFAEGEGEDEGQKEPFYAEPSDTDL